MSAVRYSIEVGRWTGIFSFVYYADVFVEGVEDRYHTFDALTKKRALNKAKRFVKRLQANNDCSEVYSYDAINDILERVS